MNKERRERLKDVQGTINEAIDSIFEIRDEEQEAFEAMPFGIQSSERGSNMLDAVAEMEDIVDNLETVTSRIENFSY